MKKKLHIVSIVALLFNSSLMSFIRGRSFFFPRSQSVHAERELVGWQEDINLCVDCQGYGALYIMPLFSRSNKPCEIANYLLGAQTFVVSGRNVDERQDDELFADYFGLPFDYKSTITFSPRIENISCDFGAYVGLDEWFEGTYIRFHAPLVLTSWNLCLREVVEAYGSASYPAGYMANDVVLRGNMSRDVTSWFAGCQQVGDIEPLKYGKINGQQSRSGLSEIQVAFGWNFVLDDDYHFGLNLRTSIPTSNRSTSFYFFEPMIGNGGHWELGFGMTGHAHLWSNCDETRSFALYGDLNLTHLFDNTQRRSFDFKKNGASSRYMLLEDMGSPVVQGLMVGGAVAENQYRGRLIPAVNVTTLLVDVSVALQVDAVLKLAYYHNCFTVEIGYDFWGRTSESIACREAFPNDRYAIKGDAQVYGFNRDNQRFVAINATQSSATMRGGQGAGNTNFLNGNADNAADATFEFAPGNDELTLKPPVLGDILGSNQAILLKDCDIDSLSAVAPSALSHSFFVHTRYTGSCCTDVVPFIGIGAEVTVDGSGSKRNNALSEWAVWLKGGLSY